MMDRFSRDLTFGAQYLGRGRTRFRFWAPSQKNVRLILGGGEIAMAAQPGGWFAVEAECGPGTRYRFRLDDGMAVPDPASRAQAEGVHGPSVVVEPLAYTWRNPNWRGRPWRETVLYELHAGAMGGFAGVERDLPRLARLGITAIELMPLNDFPGARNWGYDGVLPYAPAHAYGAPDELKALIDAAHGLGLMVFLDVVYNHFGPDGNYLSVYAPAIFHRDAHSGWGAALDFSAPELRRFFAENALYWLMEYRFDGLRFDAVHAIGDRSWLTETAAEIRRTVEPGRHVHLVVENDNNDAGLLSGAFDAQWNDDGHHALHVLLTEERDGYYADYADNPAERLARCLRDGFIYQGEPSPYRGGKRRGEPSGKLPPTAFVLFLQNHDQIGNRPFGERLTVLADPAALDAALTLVLLAPSIPMLFMGEETASATPFLYFTDHHGELAALVREGRRREFASFAGFSDPAIRDRIPDPNDEATFRASLPCPDTAQGGARLVLVETLLRLRRERVVPVLDGATAIDAAAIGAAAVTARWRMGDGAIMTLAANFGDAPVRLGAIDGAKLFESREGAARDVVLAARAAAAFWRPAS
ncbi:MAG TPA: malto-oligosyltrehalose trehalohydrolase [Stellaceae bacterium]|nr:malto-oligosyltrehalose trehalohydrolase [Stellaceae bacterium]